MASHLGEKMIFLKILLSFVAFGFSILFLAEFWNLVTKNKGDPIIIGAGFFMILFIIYSKHRSARVREGNSKEQDN